MKINQKLIDIINQVLENSSLPTVQNVKPEQDLRNDLGLDSLALAELTVRIEEQFGIDVFEDGLISKVDQIMSKIHAN